VETETHDQMVVFTLEPDGWWATWLPGQDGTVAVHGGNGPVPQESEELVSLGIWDVFETGLGDDADEVEAVLKSGGFRVVSRECRTLDL
jgi:hypothetical protein